MCILEKKIDNFKKQIEECITHAGYENTKGEFKSSDDGYKALRSFIRSRIPINNIHEAVKETFIKDHKVNENLVYPPLNKTSPELKFTGRIKAKDQDVCIIPDGKTEQQEKVDTYLGKKDDKYGLNFFRATLVINVRSQIVSISKNTDTIFERTFAEPINLNLRDKNIVLGDFFLIPIKEIDIEQAKNNKVGYKKLKPIVIEKYIRFFSSINNKENKNDSEQLISYSECCLILVDFEGEKPKIYKNTQDLIKDGIISNDFCIPINDLYFYNVVEKLYTKYQKMNK